MRAIKLNRRVGVNGLVSDAAPRGIRGVGHRKQTIKEPARLSLGERAFADDRTGNTRSISEIMLASELINS